MSTIEELNGQAEDLWFQEDLQSLKADVESNGSNQESVESREVNKFKDLIEKQRVPLTHWNREKPEISITFDDGYWPDNIRHILNTLEWSWIHATFFVLWDCLKNTPDLWKQAIDKWHQVCCHTFNHIYLSNSSEITNLTSWLNKSIKIDEWVNNVKTLLWNEYFENIKNKSGEWFPSKIKSSILLETEILMWEAQIRNTVWEVYLQNLKQNYPFFRFPGWCGANRSENVAVLKKLWYLSICCAQSE